VVVVRGAIDRAAIATAATGEAEAIPREEVVAEVQKLRDERQPAERG
jgi:hypothetical protein